MTAIVTIPIGDKTHGVYRVECSGILGILTALNILYKQYSITQGAVSLGCVGLFAL